MSSGTRCGTFAFPQRECHNCYTKMDYIPNTTQKGLEPFRAHREHAWVCPKCHRIEREPM